MKPLILNPEDENFDVDDYKNRISEFYRPFKHKEIPVGVKMRDISNPHDLFGIVDSVLPGDSPNYNKPVHCTLLGWCTEEDLLKNLEYFDGQHWLTCGVSR